MHDGDQAFLLFTNFVSDEVTAEYTKLRRDAGSRGQAWLLLQTEGNLMPWNRGRVYPWCLADCAGLGYAPLGNSIIPGRAQLPIFKFFLDHPEYRYYWLIENDVRFTGDWSVLFDAFRDIDADLLTSHIRRYEDEPDWPLYPLSHPRQTIPPQRWLRCFHPIYRISHRALVFLHEVQREGWVGHSELLMPTLLHVNAFRLVDFGGEGRFVLPGMRNRFYRDAPANPAGELVHGTMRYRPVRTGVGSKRNKLYHPIKPRRVA